MEALSLQSEEDNFTRSCTQDEAQRQELGCNSDNGTSVYMYMPENYAET